MMLTVMMLSLIDIMAAFGLGVASGLSTFLPLALIALAARAGLITLAPPFDALASNVAVGSLTVLAALEVAVDAEPRLDAVVHKLLFPFAVASGAVLFAAQTGAVSAVHPGAGVVFGLLAGGATAFTVHGTRGVLRPFVRRVPIVRRLVAFAEDGVAVLLAGAAAFVPWAVPLILAATVGALALMLFVGIRCARGMLRMLSAWLRPRTARIDPTTFSADPPTDAAAFGGRFAWPGEPAARAAADVHDIAHGPDSGDHDGTEEIITPVARRRRMPNAAPAGRRSTTHPEPRTARRASGWRASSPTTDGPTTSGPRRRRDLSGRGW